MVRTRMPGGVGGKAREGLPIPIERQTSGFVEGLNNKIKVMKRRCYGIYNLKHMFQRLHLDISGYQLYAINKGFL